MNVAIEIVDLPIKKWWFSIVGLPKGMDVRPNDVEIGQITYESTITINDSKIWVGTRVLTHQGVSLSENAVYHKYTPAMLKSEN